MGVNDIWRMRGEKPNESDKYGNEDCERGEVKNETIGMRMTSMRLNR